MEILTSLNHFCSELAENELVIQGAGGNISVKDNGLLYVKASGMQMADALKKDIFVSLDLEELLYQFSNRQELTLLRSSKSQLRPSIETFFHALMSQRYVLHLHAVDVLAFLVKNVFDKKLLEEINTKFKYIEFDYIKPGVDLARAFYKEIHLKPDCDLVLLKNHGIVISANDLESLSYKLDILLDICKPVNIFPLDEIPPVPDLRAIGLKSIVDSQIQNLVYNEVLYSHLVKNWALCPDHVVFLGPVAYCFDSIKDYKNFKTQSIHIPNLVFIKGIGVYYTLEYDNAIKSQLRCYLNLIIRLFYEDELSTLTKFEVEELVNWEAEKYRKNVQSE